MCQVPCKLVAFQVQPRDIFTKNRKCSLLVANISKSEEISWGFRDVTLSSCLWILLANGQEQGRGRSSWEREWSVRAAAFIFLSGWPCQYLSLELLFMKSGLFVSPLTYCLTFSFITSAGTLMNKLGKSKYFIKPVQKKSINPKKPTKLGACAPACQRFWHWPSRDAEQV